MALLNNTLIVASKSATKTIPKDNPNPYESGRKAFAAPRRDSRLIGIGALAERGGVSTRKHLAKPGEAQLPPRGFPNELLR
jgi:hypothetical protein